VRVRPALTVALAITLGSVLGPSISAAEAQQVTANCDTPPSTRDACNRWYTTDSVLLDWDWNPPATKATGCDGATFTSEGRVERSCTVEWPDTSITKKVWIGIDRTPPQVLAPQPSRPPDYNGWFNHPVDLAFSGSDATSGVASCSSTTFAGPEGAGVPVSGSCQDVAGNVGVGSFGLNYDPTPPPAPLVTARPGNRRVVLSWSRPPEAEATEVVRFTRGASPTRVFFGQAAGYTDSGLKNEKPYRYSVAVLDRAGNRAQAQVRAVPTASKLLNPPRGARVENPPLLVWKPVRRARYYNVQLHRSGKVLTRWPRTTQLQLRSSWRFRGERFRLAPGRYRWYVWPGFGRRSAQRYGRLLGTSTFRVVR
jgi:hypothetical protein